MIILRTNIALAALLLSAQPVLAQDTLAYRRLVEEYTKRLGQGYSPVTYCPTGPGVAFGVLAYQCASCSYNADEVSDTEASGGRGRYVTVRYRPQFGFQAEPVLLRTAPNSLLKSGDVIESVDGQPITTRAGSDAFTYPANGDHVIRVRRAGTSMDITVSVSARCAKQINLGLPDSLFPSGYWRGKDPGSTQVVPAAPEVKLDQVSITANHRYGFGVSCLPLSCALTRARDGSEYYKFDGYPTIIGLNSGSVAERTGLRKGDRIVEVDGLSILGVEGARRFMRFQEGERRSLTVLRSGERLEYKLKTLSLHSSRARDPETRPCPGE